MPKPLATVLSESARRAKDIYDARKVASKAKRVAASEQALDVAKNAGFKGRAVHAAKIGGRRLLKAAGIIGTGYSAFQVADAWRKHGIGEAGKVALSQVPYFIPGVNAVVGGADIVQAVRGETGPTEAVLRSLYSAAPSLKPKEWEFDAPVEESSSPDSIQMGSIDNQPTAQPFQIPMSRGPSEEDMMREYLLQSAREANSYRLATRVRPRVRMYG